MQWVLEVAQLVKGGLYVNNLRSILFAASKGQHAGDLVIPAFVIRGIAASVLDIWDGNPLQQGELKIVEDGLRPPLNDLLAAIQRRAPKQEILDLTEKLINFWAAVQQELREREDLSRQ